jgi:hypothetical protein
MMSYPASLPRWQLKALAAFEFCQFAVERL